MREALLYLLPCVYAFLACIGFSMLFNIHGAGMLICAGGGALGWLCYLLTGWWATILSSPFLPPWSSRPGRR